MSDTAPPSPPHRLAVPIIVTIVVAVVAYLFRDTIEKYLDYNWLRAGHILSVIAWMAGLLMLPRLLVYRLESGENSGMAAKMDEAAIRLKKIILTNAMHLSWLFGILLIWQNWGYLHRQPAFWAKFAFVIILTGAHFYFTAMQKKIAAGQVPMDSKKLRMINEIPFVLAILIVVLAVVFLP